MVKFDSEKILNLVNDRIKGKIMLPEIQRRFVWKPRQVLSLIDSLKNDYPIGSFLLWKTEDEIETRTFDTDVGSTQKRYTEMNYLLDGQQRLTSLELALSGKTKILLNLETDELELEKGSNRRNNKFVPLNELFSNEEGVLKRVNFGQLQEKITKRGYRDNPKLIEKLMKLQEIFEKDVSLIIVDKNRAYEDVAEIFIRINSRGVYITKQDLAYSKITLAVPGISKSKILPALKQFERSGFPFSPGFLVKLIVAIETGQTKVMLSDKIWKERLKGKINERWDSMIESLKQAIDFLKNDVGINSLDELTSETIIVVLTYLFNRHKSIDQNASIRKKVKYWIYSAQFWARYSGSSETLLDRDLKIIQEKEIFTAIDELIAEIGRTPKEIKPEMFRTHSKNSPEFKIYYLIMKQRLGDRETSKEVLSISNKKEDHHLFPRKLLKKRDIDEKLINDISNLTFISKKRNLNISAKDPELYFESLWNSEGEEFFDRHLIPKDKELWKLDRYLDFVRKRRELIAEQVIAFMENIN